MTPPILASLLPYLKGFVGCLVALLLTGLVVAGAHLWADHQQLHQVITVLNTLIQKQPQLFK